MKASAFWFMELYESGFKDQLTKLLWKIYYDFFALNSNFTIIKYKNDVNRYNLKKDVLFLFNFVNKLCQSQYSFDIFIIRMFFSDEENKNKFSSENYEPLLKLLFKGNKVEKYYKYLKLGLSYTTKEKLIKIVNKIKGKKFKENYMYDNLAHQLLVHTYVTDLKVKKSLKSVKKNIVSYIERCKKFDCKTTDTLQNYRDYEISELTSCFSLQREKLDKPVTEYFWYNWVYYSRQTPYWKKKLDEHKYIVVDQAKKVIFDVDDGEEFYEKYSYDLDELDFDTRNKSTKILNKNNNLKDFLLKVNEKTKLILNISKKLDIIKNKY